MDKLEARKLLIPVLAELLADPKGLKLASAHNADTESVYEQWRRARQTLELHCEVPRFADARALENALREIL